MAVKKDANGDRLCAPCLDARRANRNTAFLRQEGRQEEGRAATSSQSSTGLLDSAPSTDAPARPRILRIASAVRVPRNRVSEDAKVAAPAADQATQLALAAASKLELGRSRRLKTSAPKAAKSSRAPERAPRRAAKPGAREQAFVQLAAEVGFIRTRQLLAELRQKSRALR
jgi:hypothetical protein